MEQEDTILIKKQFIVQITLSQTKHQQMRREANRKFMD